MLVDTHAHLYLDPFAEDLSAVLQRAREAGVGRIVMPAIDVPSTLQAVELSRIHHGVFAMAGLHPSQTKDASEDDFEAVAGWCGDANVLAVGETGLDYYWDRSFEERQQTYLRRHIRLAVEKDLPVVFHNREAFDDLIRIVEEERAALSDPHRLRGVFHCFTGSADDAARVYQAGFFVGIGGILTFKGSELVETMRHIPLEWIVLETDAPYLAPSPYRGKRNEPAHLRLIASKLAEASGHAFQEVAKATTVNAEKLFRLPCRE